MTEMSKDNPESTPPPGLEEQFREMLRKANFSLFTPDAGRAPAAETAAGEGDEDGLKAERLKTI